MTGSKLRGVVVVAVLCLVPLADRAALALERPELHFDKRKWKQGFQANQSNQRLVEYVLEGETVENWSELVTAQLLLGVQEKSTLDEYLKFSEKVLRGSAKGNVEWKVIRRGPKEVLYEWKLTNDPKIPDQHEIARVIVGREGFHVLHYAAKTSKLPDDKRQEWIRLLSAARILE